MESLIGDLPSNNKEFARTIFCTENKDEIFQTGKFINLCFTKRQQLRAPQNNEKFVFFFFFLSSWYC